MYSFAQRPDTVVVDEPLYAHYLAVTRVDHPGKDEVLETMDNYGDRVVEQVILGPQPKPVVFFKHIAKHLVSLNIDFLLQTRNLFLIREPDQMLTSLVQQLPKPTLQETALKEQWELYSFLQQQGKNPVVVDSKDILLDPKKVLGKVCEQLGIPFHEEMLAWEAGPRPEDGVWAKYWYNSVHQSTGFATYKRKHVPVREDLLPLLETCQEYYDQLYKEAIQA